MSDRLRERRLPAAERAEARDKRRADRALRRKAANETSASKLRPVTAGSACPGPADPTSWEWPENRSPSSHQFHPRDGLGAGLRRLGCGRSVAS
jgi:hypothetical protein